MKMAPKACIPSPPPTNHYPIGLSPASHSLTKVNSSDITTSRRVPPIIRIVHVFAPKLIKTDASNFRALVQKLTGNSPSCSTDEGIVAADPVRTTYEQKRKKQKTYHIGTASTEVPKDHEKQQSTDLRDKSTEAIKIQPTDPEEVQNLLADPASLLLYGDDNQFLTPKDVVSSACWDSYGSVDHHSVLSDLDLICDFNSSNAFPELPQYCPTDTCHDQYSSPFQYESSWRFTVPPTFSAGFE